MCIISYIVLVYVDVYVVLSDFLFFKELVAGTFFAVCGSMIFHLKRAIGNNRKKIFAKYKMLKYNKYQLYVVIKLLLKMFYTCSHSK